MQCREFFIMADLSDKYYTEKNSVANTQMFAHSIQKRYFTSQNAITRKKQITCSHIVWKFSILVVNFDKVLKKYFKTQKQLKVLKNRFS